MSAYSRGFYSLIFIIGYRPPVLSFGSRMLDRKGESRAKLFVKCPFGTGFDAYVRNGDKDLRVDVPQNRR